MVMCDSIDFSDTILKISTKKPHLTTKNKLLHCKAHVFDCYGLYLKLYTDINYMYIYNLLPSDLP